MSGQLSFAEAGVIGALQGVSELFPVSSLGHAVLVPAWIGGSWAQDLNVSRPESPYLAYIVGLHVATALALIIYFWRDWVRIVGGLLTSIRHRRVETASERLAWLLVLATIPVGIVGLFAEHLLRTTLGKPVPTACFLIVNGGVLFLGERLTRKQVDVDESSVAVGTGPGGEFDERAMGEQSDVVLGRLPVWRAILVGTSQILALAPGISRSGVATVTGMVRGLSREDAARLSFLLATPVILAAGVLKIPDLFGPLGNGIRPQVLFGSLLAGVAAYLSVRFLTRYFVDRSLRPFAFYCVIAGVASLILFAVR